MLAFFRQKKIYFVLAILVVSQLLLTITLCTFTFDSNKVALVDFVIVIDAGHGGVDGGVVGVAGSKESDLNLDYAKALGNAFAERGFAVVYTRENQGGLYGMPTKGFKMRDMNKRKQVIVDSNASLVVSIHMNNYADRSRSGPQVFYQKGSQDGYNLATSIQSALNKFTGNSHQSLSGDFFICRCADVPSVIVECGFLSNPTEEQQLLDKSYRDALVEEIFVGVMMYLYSN